MVLPNGRSVLGVGSTPRTGSGGGGGGPPSSSSGGGSTMNKILNGPGVSPRHTSTRLKTDSRSSPLSQVAGNAVLKWRAGGAAAGAGAVGGTSSTGGTAAGTSTTASVAAAATSAPTPFQNGIVASGLAHNSLVGAGSSILGHQQHEVVNKTGADSISITLVEDGVVGAPAGALMSTGGGASTSATTGATSSASGSGPSSASNSFSEQAALSRAAYDLDELLAKVNAAKASSATGTNFFAAAAVASAKESNRPDTTPGDGQQNPNRNTTHSSTSSEQQGARAVSNSKQSSQFTGRRGLKSKLLSSRQMSTQLVEDGSQTLTSTGNGLNRGDFNENNAPKPLYATSGRGPRRKNQHGHGSGGGGATGAGSGTSTSGAGAGGAGVNGNATTSSSTPGMKNSGGGGETGNIATAATTLQLGSRASAGGEQIMMNHKDAGAGSHHPGAPAGSDFHHGNTQFNKGGRLNKMVVDLGPGGGQNGTQSDPFSDHVSTRSGTSETFSSASSSAAVEGGGNSNFPGTSTSTSSNDYPHVNIVPSSGTAAGGSSSGSTQHAATVAAPGTTGVATASTTRARPELTRRPFSFFQQAAPSKRRRTTVFRDDRAHIDSRQVVNRLLLASLEAVQAGTTVKRKCGWAPPPTQSLFPLKEEDLHRADEVRMQTVQTVEQQIAQGDSSGLLEFNANFECANLLHVSHVEPELSEAQLAWPGGETAEPLAEDRRGTTHHHTHGLPFGQPSSGGAPSAFGGQQGGSASSSSSAGGGAAAGNHGGNQIVAEFELQMRADSQVPIDHSTCQWFLFACRKKVDRGAKCRFRIWNFRKPKSCYQVGLQPYVYRVKAGKDTLDNVWSGSSCRNVDYGPYGNAEPPKPRWGPLYSMAQVEKQPQILPTGAYSGDTFSALPKSEYYQLSFDFEFEGDDEVVFFAAYPPYSYTMLLRFLREVDQLNSPNIAKKEIGRTLANIPVPLLIVTNPKVQGSSKKDVVVIARQHPGECVGSWAAQGFIKFLIGNSSLANLLRTTHVFHIVPMVNVDGVVYGNNRCTLLGVDPNRCWVEPNAVLHPLVSKIKAYVSSLNNAGPRTSTGTQFQAGERMQSELTSNLTQKSSSEWVEYQKTTRSLREQEDYSDRDLESIKSGNYLQLDYEKFLNSSRPNTATATAGGGAGTSNGGAGKNVVLFLDIHGHSARTHAFLYGCLPQNIRVNGQNITPPLLQAAFLEEETNIELQKTLLGKRFVEVAPAPGGGGSAMPGAGGTVVGGGAGGAGAAPAGAGGAGGSAGPAATAGAAHHAAGAAANGGAPAANAASGAAANGAAGAPGCNANNAAGAGDTNNKNAENHNGADQPSLQQVVIPPKMLRLCAQHAAFPKICALASTDFSLAHCNWNVSKAHRRAARWVFYKQLDIVHSFTVEISLFGICSSGSRKPDGQKSIQLFTPRRAEWIGVALGRSLVPHLQPDSTNSLEIAASPSSLPFLTFDKLQGEKLIERILRSFEMQLTEVFARDNTLASLMGKVDVGGHSDSDHSDNEKPKKKKAAPKKKNSTGGGNGAGAKKKKTGGGDKK